MPLNNARWDVYLPPDYDYQKFAGSMTHEAQAAPALQSYSLSEYRAQEARTETSQTGRDRPFISNARQNLAISNIKGIDQNKLNGNYDTQLDSATRQALEDVKQKVDHRQCRQPQSTKPACYNNCRRTSPCADAGQAAGTRAI